MRTLTVIILTLATVSAWARTSYETGNGQEIGYCSYIQGYFCISGVKTRAENEAKRQAEWSCQMKRGQPLTYSGSCNSTCFPNMITPGEQNQLVQCRSTCTIQCDIQE